MGSISAAIQRPLVRLMGKQILAAETAEASRAVIDRWGRWMSVPRGVQFETTSLGNVPGLRATPAGQTTDSVLLVLHGGGYIFGTAQGYRAHGARLAKSVPAPAYILDYRLAPEHPYPAAVEDALAAYRAILESHAAEKIAFIGDSAGGGLALATMHRARDAGLPLPACAVLLCPWLDISGSGESMQSNAASEIIVPPPVLARMAQAYAGGRDLTDVGMSPLFGDHAALPPLLLQVSKTETLYSDSERFAPMARAAGTSVELDVYDDMWHDWQLMAPLVRESRQAMASAAAFLKQHLTP